MNLAEILSNPFLLMFSSIFLGQIVGKISYKNIKLGSSGGLFVGIAISYFVTRYLKMEGLDSQIINSSFISTEIFKLSLIGFIASVGLLAAKNIRKTIKDNGYKFMVLAFIITLTGALSTFIFLNIFSGFKISAIGTYVGALTSSPGLATALESAKDLSRNAESMIGLGYSISYIPGVIIVILFVQLLGNNHQKNEIIKNQNITKEEVKESSFSVISFVFVGLLGVIIGKFNIYLGEYLGNFSLGSTGGVLISALILGDLKKIGFLDFNIRKDQLSVLRDISLNMFLSIVGLNYGYDALNLIRTSGLQLIIMGTTTAILSIIVGYIVGKKIFKLKTIYLIGGICGGMTSTPGLAASIESLDSDDVTVGYGATYPFALFFMILFTNILFKI